MSVRGSLSTSVAATGAPTGSPAWAVWATLRSGVCAANEGGSLTGFTVTKAVTGPHCETHRL